MAGVTSLTSFGDWIHLLSSFKNIILITPGIAAGLSTYYLLRRMSSPYTFPLCMAAVLALFYISMALSGGSFQSARDFGWISEMQVQSGIIQLRPVN